MSLVRDALAKAEREAAARAAREQGLPAALSGIPQPYRARRRARWPWAVGLAGALAGAIAVVVLLRAQQDSVSDPPFPAVSPPAIAATGPAPRETEETPFKGEATSAATPAAVAASPPPATSASAPSPAVRVSAPPARESVAVAGSSPAALAAPEEIRESSVSAEGGTKPPAPPGGGYVLEVGLGRGRAIRLGGIAWSEAAPLAYLNGRLVGVGEYVEGYRVVAIERDLVRFDGGDGRPDLRFEVRLR